MKIEFLSTGDLASLCDVDRRTIGNWLRAGRIPKPEQIGRVNRHPVEETLQAIANNGLALGENGIPNIAKLLEHNRACA